MKVKELFDDAGVILNWKSGINWYFASHTDKGYLETALHRVLGWNDYDCSQHIFKNHHGEWEVRFHY